MPPSFVAPPPRAAGTRSLGQVVLRRPGVRRGLALASLALSLSALVLFGYPVGTDAYSSVRQRDLRQEFETPALRKAYVRRAVDVGDGLTRLRIPVIGLEVLVVEGVTEAALRAGAGHYPGTPLPGERGNVGVAGHRVTYGRPFHRLDEVRPGDLVELETPFAVHTYRVPVEVDGHPNPWVVAPTDVGVVAQDVPGSVLTLTTCHPKGSARERLVLRAELIASARRSGAQPAAAGAYR